jgi:hypothetical protein
MLGISGDILRKEMLTLSKESNRRHRDGTNRRNCCYLSEVWTLVRRVSRANIDACSMRNCLIDS